MIKAKAKEFLTEARGAIQSGASEAVVRYKFEHFLPQIYPDIPWWVKVHAQGAESHTKFNKEGKARYGFVDSLVGATAIEYEPNLTKIGVEAHAKDQVKDYVAGEVNKGTSIDIILGVISDTLRWKAFRPRIRENDAQPGHLSGKEILLEEIDAIDLTTPSSTDTEDLNRFLIRHIGRIGARPLHGEFLANDLGLESKVGGELRQQLDKIANLARAKKPSYAELIDRLWSELVDSIGKKGNSRSLGSDEYLDEFYLITLAKLICANVLDGNAVHRSDDEIQDILNGRFFSGRGLQNYVEYDLFGWLAEDAQATGMLDIAKAIQEDLVVYDFTSVEAEDLFGQLLARLGRHSTRLILGQELTPPWLARKIVRNTAKTLNDLRLVDIACGSGTLLIEALKYERSRSVEGETPSERAKRIAAAATGFDIDPLAALFAKTNWVIAMRDELPNLGDIAIPVYHADSLFAGLYSQAGDDFVLKLDQKTVSPPESLIKATGRAVFDHLLTNVYRVAMQEAQKSGEPETKLAKSIAQAAINESSDTSQFDENEISSFAAILISELALLQRSGRNGLWLYIIRNTSRAAQSFSQFNAMVINPPWLTLSKISNNPYGHLLDSLANELGVRPAGPSFLHTELAAIFLLEGLRRYVEPQGRFACILPSTIAEGHHQNRFRSGAFTSAGRPVDLNIKEIWSVASGVFKNEAIIAFGKKERFQSHQVIPGKEVSEESETAKQFHVVTAEYDNRPNRTIWTPNKSKKTPAFGFDPAPFRQGADLMPRTAWFHEFSAYGTDRSVIKPLTSSSDDWFLISDAKNSKSFRLRSGTVVSRSFVKDALLSNHLCPFTLASPSQMLIPSIFTGAEWRELSGEDLIHAPGATDSALQAICRELGVSISGLYQKIDVRGKLRRQVWAEGSFLVFSGTGGANPCAAWVPPSTFIPGDTIFDQTVYWAPVSTLEEAAYLAGAINSPSCAELIAPFQPRGQQGKRHIHKLPFGVTPPFDREEDLHWELSQATLALQNAWQQILMTDPEAQRRTRPNHSNLQNRRRWVMNVLRELPDWERYTKAAAALYGSV
ncbi:MAG: hypothetical protein CME36_00005 [unclassified Hahellaceae]|nr:hypothetical protein [Hahellaceae bacterium]|tara:strand:- start:387 stop:3581 length:3195 start_codon:yes stop_codon:yes gene_type:complete